MIEGLKALDLSVFLAINSFHAEWLNPLMQFLSGQSVWIPFIGYFFWYAYKNAGKKYTLYFGLFLLMALVASDVTSSYILKNIVNRLRPCREIDLQPLIYSFGQKCGGKFGFVSSHAANSVVLVFFSIRALSFQKNWIYWLWIIPFMVGYSRIYLGVHYPGDILGGTIIGLWWGYVFSWMYQSIQGAKR
ncbi:MAG: phosphatase PAP2 family protein [Bacteriovoracaceae bacterium]|nr:phosphatase PAP2 family protein [Bacteriovoracaceae bacterium]